MSKKLLSEAQVRRFQSLASIKPLQEMGNYAMKRDEEEPMEEAMNEEEVEEGYYKRDDEEPQEGMYKEEEYMEEKMEDDDDDLDIDMDGDGDDVEIEEEMVEKAAAALSDLQALIDALGGEAAGEMDMDDAPEMPAMDDAPEMDDEKPEPLEEEDLVELALEGIEYQPSQKEIVKEVAKRVARRLQEAKQAKATYEKALGKK